MNNKLKNKLSHTQQHPPDVYQKTVHNVSEKDLKMRELSEVFPSQTGNEHTSLSGYRVTACATQKSDELWQAAVSRFREIQPM